MIRYDLNCGNGHEFDVWFRDSATAERQLAGRALECPVCGDGKVAKAIMAPRIGKAAPSRIVDAEQPPASVPAKAAMLPPELGVQLREMRRQVEANCDYVGPRFAEEARKIHNGESDARAIYGEASEEQHRDLLEEGIEVARIPWLPREDA